MGCIRGVPCDRITQHPTLIMAERRESDSVEKPLEKKRKTKRGTIIFF